MKTKVQQFLEGQGVVRMWSTCPSIDLLDLVKKPDDEVLKQDAEPLEILSVAPADIGSLLMTMCRLRRKKLKSEVDDPNVCIVQN